jgi:AraC family L-rhamnose operon regulatory protein RhaS
MAESQHSDDFRMDWTCHPFLKVLYVWEGTGALWTSGRKYGIQASCIVLIPAGLRHRIVDTPSKAMSIFILCVVNPFVTALAENGGLTACRVIDHRTMCVVTKRLVMDILYEQTLSRPGGAVLIIGLTLELMGLLIRWRAGSLGEPQETISGKPLSHARVTASIRDLENHFYRPQSLEEMAERVGLKPRRYSQLFRMITGKTWPSFLRYQRVEHAKRLMIQTNRSLIAIGFECGFEDITSFYRAFGRSEGTSPNAWRKKEQERLAAGE